MATITLPTPPPRLLNPEQTAEYLGLKAQTLAVWRMSGKYLRFIKCGRSIRYRLTDIEMFLNEHTVGGKVPR